jgi:plasmid stabilization system protein ParE
LARLIYAGRALADLDRLTAFLIKTDPKAALKTVALIEEAVKVLARHPLIGRPVEPPLRELVISRGKTGYLALYSFEPADDAVLILALRHQRELGYPDDTLA